MPRAITPAELNDLRRAGQTIDLIDVRTPAEFRELHVEFAHNIPLDQLQESTIQASRRQAPSETLYLICQRGGRGELACKRLIAAGCTNVVNVEGGTIACEAAGLPMVRGQPTMSLERQVRIAAGSLVVTGSVLAYFVHPYWLALSAFVGAGLLFAGVTNTCGMALVLARMPWNQVHDAQSSCLRSVS